MDFHSIIGNYASPGILAASPVTAPVFIFILSVLFLLTFLISGSEVAFFNLTLKDVNMLKTRPQPSYKRIVDLLEKPKILQASLFITHSILNIAIILIANMLLNEAMAELAVPVALLMIIKIAIMVVGLVLFTEILPKIWATNHKIWFASSASMIVEIFYLLFYKISNWLVRIGDSIESGLDSSSKETDNTQLDDAIDLLHEASPEEKQLLKGVRKFGNTTVKQTMKTRLDVSGIDILLTYPEVLTKIRRLQYSRVPVYRKSLDSIEGILHTKDLLAHVDEQPGFEWQKLIRPVFYVHEHKLIEDLLQDFRNRHIHMAVVVDEFGGTSGIITLEDIMEEIIGDIQDEFDNEESINRKIDDHNYLFDGRTMINDFCRKLGLPQNTFDKVRGESDSVAGLILEIAGEFPPVNAEIKYGKFIFVPLEINKNRIERVRITLEPVYQS